MRILITGAAGFIGSALSIKLIEKGESVLGIDNLNSYYDVNLKMQRIKNIENLCALIRGDWNFEKCELENNVLLNQIFSKFEPDVVVNLAAQAGVRYSLQNPLSYLNSNLLGFGNILEECRKFKVGNLIYASSSSVYGGNKNIPFNENQAVDHPVSLYAATKRSNELMAHSYSHIYGIPSTGLRFFTVYGPWGRPDMAPMIFTKSILNNKPINVFNYGKMKRDFTFIDDIVEGIFHCCYKPAIANKEEDISNIDASTSFAPHLIFNIGNSNSVELLKFINVLEEEIGNKAIIKFVKMLPVDVVETEADTTKLKNWINFSPKTSIEEGIKKFVDWYKNYYKVS